jgi:hypothetical protein
LVLLTGVLLLNALVAGVRVLLGDSAKGVQV